MHDFGGKPVIRFAPGLLQKMLASVGRLEPEHYAILSGRLTDPFYVTGFMPMPPAFDPNGRRKASAGSVTLNAPFIEYYLNTALVPFGDDLLGIIHSHPGDFDRLSDGVAGSGQGDIPSMRAHLETAARQGLPWLNYLAPIVTRPGDNPKVTGFVVRLDRRDPIPAEVVWESARATAVDQRDAPPLHEALSPAALIARFNLWQKPINAVRRRKPWPKRDRDELIELLRRARAHDLATYLSRVVAADSGVKPSAAEDVPKLQFGDCPALLNKAAVR